MQTSPGTYLHGVALDHGSRTPVYLQLADVLQERIESGELPPGRMIPSEKDLQQQYGAGRGTVRKAIAVLRERALVDTVPQRGTFVLPQEGRGRDAAR
jgi:GntR family transcriptional regulator